MDEAFENWYNAEGINYVDLSSTGFARMIFKAGWNARHAVDEGEMY